jgi:hypothetical protein
MAMIKSFELTAADKAAFDTFGFLSFPGLLTHRISGIIDAFEGVWSERGGGHAGKPHEGKARSCIVPFIDQSEVLSGLLEDPAVDAILTGLLGDDYNYMGSDGNYYVGDTAWHSDGWSKTTRFLKMAFYLDPLTRDTGALRVIPGSHRPGTEYSDRLQTQIHDSKKHWNMEGRQVPAVALETRPGDIAVFNHNTKHASFGGSTVRRMFTINCCQRIPDSELPTLKGYISSFARFWVDGVYGPAMLAGPDRRRIHLEQVQANEGHLPALTARARKEMLEPARG